MCRGGCECQPGTESLDYSVISSHELLQQDRKISVSEKSLWWPEQSRGDQTRAGRPGPDFLMTLMVVGRTKDI